jgi:hypothetical protein
MPRTLRTLYEEKNISFYWKCDWPQRVLCTPPMLHMELRVASNIVNKERYSSVCIAYIARMACIALCVAAALLKHIDCSHNASLLFVKNHSFCHWKHFLPQLCFNSSYILYKEMKTHLQRSCHFYRPQPVVSAPLTFRALHWIALALLPALDVTYTMLKVRN